MIVLKFGGTSVKDAAAVRQVESILENGKGNVLVVVSALSGVTNTLVRLVEQFEAKEFDDCHLLIEEIREKHEGLITELSVQSICSTFLADHISFLKRIMDSVDILGEVTPKTRDLVLSMGETLSSFIIAAYLKNRDFSIEHIDATRILKTNSRFNEAEVDWKLTGKAVKEHLYPLFDKNKFVVTGGFIGSDKEGKTTTLGRGGSDYSAAVFASVLNAIRLDIWTDVDGILTCDPRFVRSAYQVEEVSYEEAAELAYFGAKVLHPKTIFPAIKANIPVYVRNTFNPSSHGTRIVPARHIGLNIKAIAFRRNITIINITSNRMLGAYGFLARVFQVFDQFKTPVDLVSTSEVSISCTIDNLTCIEDIVSNLNAIATVQIFHDKAIISAIGEGIRDSLGIVSRFFSALKGFNISLVTMGASEINLSIVVDENDLETVVNNLHYEFFEKQVTL